MRAGANLIVLDTATVPSAPACRFCGKSAEDHDDAFLVLHPYEPMVASHSPHPATRRCLVCHRPESQVEMRLCDAPLQSPSIGETCGRAVCVDHAYKIDAVLDYCPAHARGMHEGERSGSG